MIPRYRAVVVAFVFLIFIYTFLSLFSSSSVSTRQKQQWTLTDIGRGERTNIYFLKAHKCASSTVQNILLRYGYFRNLYFALPSSGNYLGHPAHFNKNMIGPSLETLDGKYNILAHHSRFNYTAAKEVMYDDAVYVTILRHPAELFESLFSFYHLEKKLNIEFKELLLDHTKIKKTKRRVSRIGVNQMSFDLGLLVQKVHSDAEIQKFVESVDKQFDLVMISEYMEVSLVLLADLMNWPLSYVSFLSHNARSKKAKMTLTYTDRLFLKEINWADSVLYDYFILKLKDRVRAYGVDRMTRKVQELLKINAEAYQRCVETTNNYGYAHTLAYNVRFGSEIDCFYLGKPELAFTEEIRSWQEGNLRAIRNLRRLLTDHEEAPVVYDEESNEEPTTTDNQTTA